MAHMKGLRQAADGSWTVDLEEFSDGKLHRVKDALKELATAWDDLPDVFRRGSIIFIRLGPDPVESWVDEYGEERKVLEIDHQELVTYERVQAESTYTITREKWDDLVERCAVSPDPVPDLTAAL